MFFLQVFYWDSTVEAFTALLYSSLPFQLHSWYRPRHQHLTRRHRRKRLQQKLLMVIHGKAKGAWDAVYQTAGSQILDGLNVSPKSSNIFDRRFKHTTGPRLTFANIQIGLNQKTSFSKIFDMRSIVFRDIGDPSPLCGSWVWDGFFHRSKRPPGTSSPPTTSLTSPQRTWLAQLGNIPNWGSSLRESWHVLPLLGHPQNWVVASEIRGWSKLSKPSFRTLCMHQDSLWWEDHPLISMKTS